jgi:hypothetical protein
MSADYFGSISAAHGLWGRATRRAEADRKEERWADESSERGQRGRKRNQ